MLKSKKTIRFMVFTIILLIIMIYVGPVDGFDHGFYVEEIDVGQIAEQDWYDIVDLTNSYEMSFSPAKNHFAGFSIFFINQPDGNMGHLSLEITDESGSSIEKILVDLSDVHDQSWYKVYVSAKLKKGSIYTLRFTGNEGNALPCLQSVDDDYLPDETVEGNILISYAYAKSTFTFQNKIIIFIFAISIWILLLSFLLSSSKKKFLRVSATMFFMTAILTWNYMYNSMNNQNSLFGGVQVDSEVLVTGVIYAEQDGVWFEKEDGRYGLGIYYNLIGDISDDNWLNGFSKSEPAIIVKSNLYSRRVAVIGNAILFKNGDCYQITDVSDDGLNIVIRLSSDRLLSSAKCGSIDDITFFDSNGTQLAKSGVEAYVSQYGLQGKVFRYLARHIDEEEIVSNLHLLCCIATAFVFAVIVIFIYKKYNLIMSGCFFITFWLSPWIVNFARNLYWVEYTWFIPMAVGLFCAWKIDNKKCRIASYVMTFIAILGKSLCGYEYISSVMMGGVAFLLADLVVGLIKKNKEKTMILFRTIIIMGVAAFAGFVVAICIHAPLRGEGNIIYGIKNIFEQDVLRRTNGADLNDFDVSYWPAINVSIWEVFCMYFHFSTEIIQGVAGNLFSIICIVPLCILGYEIKCKNLDYELTALYIVFFLTSISWFCLAKSHSYIHTPMNYVLWYFGFVQICFYIIVDKIVCVFRGVDIKKIEEKK